MSIYTLATMDFSVDPAIPDAWSTATANIVQPYIDAGYCSATTTWDPTLPEWHPTSGSYVSRRDWTNETQANNCAAQVMAFRSANPQYQAYTTGPVVHNI